MSKRSRYNGRGGRHPSKRIQYSQELAVRICRKIMDGWTLGKIANCTGMPHVDTIKRWIAEKSEFKEMVKESREILGLEVGDRVVRLGEMVERGELDPQQAKVAMDAYKWTASRVAPHVYGGGRIGSTGASSRIHIHLPDDGRRDREIIDVSPPDEEKQLSLNEDEEE